MKTQILHPSATDYPSAMVRLARLDARWCQPLPPLYVRSRAPTPLPQQPAIALVGTREPSAAALRFTDEAAQALSEDGFCLWSGGARGVDAAVHAAALRGDAKTVVVTAGGLDTTYPAEHRELYQHVLAAGGALLSLQPDGAIRRRHLFLQRNAVLASLTLATVVIEAPVRSGARSTAAAARKLGRPLLVVPAAPWSVCGAGCAAELSLGAVAIASVNQLRQLARTLVAPGSRHAPLQLELGRQRRAARKAPPVTAEEAVLLALLGQEPRHLDALCDASGMPYSQVATILLGLRLGGRVVEAPPGHYLRFERLDDEP